MCVTLKYLRYPFLDQAMRCIDYKYILYARKSSESEDRQMASIEDQLAEAKKLAEKYNLKVIDVISESKSAKEPGRIGFETMLKRISKGDAQGILTWKLNRLARNPIDGGKISWMLQQNIIKHIQTFEREYNPSDNVLLMQVEFGMANQYVKDLSIDVKRGMRQKAERGWNPCVNLPIGYVHNHNYQLGAIEIIPDKNRFSKVKKLWELVLTGKYSIVEIKRRGDAIGLRNNRNKCYSNNAYHNTFSNEFYSGVYYWRDQNGDQVRYHGKHKRMISPIEFQKAQILLHGKPNSITRERSYDYPYRGMIFCGECGCTVTPDHKLQAICTKCKLKFSIKNAANCPRCKMLVSKMDKPSIIDILYYRCSKSKGFCSQKTITRKCIEEAIIEKLKEISIPEKTYNKAINDLSQSTFKLDDNKKIISELKRKESELEERISNLVNLRADGDLTQEAFSLAMQKNEKELQSAKSGMLKIRSQQIEWLNNKKDFLNFANDVVSRFKKGENDTKNEITRKLALNLKLFDKKLVISTNKSLLEYKNDSSTLTEKHLI